jgi:hypothetical protein
MEEKAAEEVVTEAAPTEPEVITKGKKDEDEAEAGEGKEKEKEKKEEKGKK